jgi:CubicO group peptidase (beta-lactamase class C family)
MSLPIAEAKERVAAILAKFDVPGAAMAMVSGDDFAAWGHGICELGGNEAVTADTTFQLASCSKAYTASSTAILVDRGELDWDDPVRRHLPEFQMHDERLSDIATLRDLLSMRLGYKNEGIVNWGRNTELGVEFIFERLRYTEVIAGFREKFTYLNPAYTLIAEVIARKTGKRFIDFQSDELHKPLGQSRTFVQEGKYLPKSSHAFPHVHLDDGIEPLGEARCGGRIGESCVYSSANDAAKWISFQLEKGVSDGKRLISEAAMDEMRRPHVYGPGVPALDNFFLAYGMGWQCRDTPSGPIILHEGGEFGISTFTILDLNRKIGACCYLNLPSAAAGKSCTYSMIDLLAGRAPKDWAGLFPRLDAQDREAMRSYVDKLFTPTGEPELGEKEIVGSYFSPANGTADVSVIAEGLDMRMREAWVYDSVLRPAGSNIYLTKARYKGSLAMGRHASPKVQFFRDEQGIAFRTLGFGTFRKLEVARV